MAEDEKDFQLWVRKYGVGNPDDPKHYYDYRTAFKEGYVPDKWKNLSKEDKAEDIKQGRSIDPESYMWSDKYKLPGHPIPSKMAKKYTVKDTETDKQVTFNWTGTKPPTDQELDEIFKEARTAKPSKSLIQKVIEKIPEKAPLKKIARGEIIEPPPPGAKTPLRQITEAPGIKQVIGGLGELYGRATAERPVVGRFPGYEAREERGMTTISAGLSEAYKTIHQTGKVPTTGWASVFGAATEILSGRSLESAALEAGKIAKEGKDFSYVLEKWKNESPPSPDLWENLLRELITAGSAETLNILTNPAQLAEFAVMGKMIRGGGKGIKALAQTKSPFLNKYFPSTIKLANWLTKERAFIKPGIKPKVKPEVKPVDPLVARNPNAIIARAQTLERELPPVKLSDKTSFMPTTSDIVKPETPLPSMLDRPGITKWGTEKLIEGGQAPALLNNKQVSLMGKAASVIRTGFKDFRRQIVEGLRIPYWTERFNPLVGGLYGIEKESFRVTRTANKFAEGYFKLKNKTRVGDILWEGNANKIEFTAAELIKKGLNSEEINAYHGVRKAIHYMQNHIMPQYMKQAGVPKEQIAGFMEQSTHKGYMPQMRFGRFGVKVSRPWGKGKKNLELATFGTEAEARNYISTISKQIPRKGKPPVEVSADVIDFKSISKDPSEFMQTLHSLPVLRNVLKKKGYVDPDIEKFVKVLGEEYYKYFARGRLAHRKGIPGFEKDVEKVLVSHFGNYPRSIIKRFKQPQIESTFKTYKDPRDMLYARKLIDYYYGRREWEGKLNYGIREFLYKFYLGLKPSFGILNSSQRLTTTFPYSVAEVGERRGLAAISRAQIKELRLYADVLKPGGGKGLEQVISRAKYLNNKEKVVLKKLFSYGELRPLREVEIGTDGGIINIFGTLSERSNRVHAALTALDVAKYKNITKLTELFPYVEKYVNDTQFLYSKTNRMQLARGWTAPIAMFKSYMLNYGNLLGKLYKKSPKAGMEATAIMLSLAGVYGLPGIETIKSTVDFFMRKRDPQWPLKYRNIEREIDENTAGILLHGLPSIIGLEGSYVFGSPEVFDIAGLPVLNQMLSITPDQITRPDINKLEQGKKILPTELKHIVRLLEYGQEGMPKDIYGKPRISETMLRKIPKIMRPAYIDMVDRITKKISVHEQILYGLGFPTRGFTEYWRDVISMRRATNEYKKQQAQYNRAIAMAFDNGDMDKVDKLIDEALAKDLYPNMGSIANHIKERSADVEEEE